MPPYFCVEQIGYSLLSVVLYSLYASGLTFLIVYHMGIHPLTIYIQELEDSAEALQNSVTDLHTQQADAEHERDRRQDVELELYAAQMDIQDLRDELEITQEKLKKTNYDTALCLIACAVCALYTLISLHKSPSAESNHTEL
jgi:hypothetical protein